MTEIESLWAQWREEQRYKSFCYWLNGFFEMRFDKTQPLTQWQLETIEKHLGLVFGKPMTASLPDLPPHPEMSRWMNSNDPS